MKIRDNLKKLRELSLICLNNQKGKKTNDIIKLKQFIFFREKPSCGSDSIWIQVERHKATLLLVKLEEEEKFEIFKIFFL